MNQIRCDCQSDEERQAVARWVLDVLHHVSRVHGQGEGGDGGAEVEATLQVGEKVRGGRFESILEALVIVGCWVIFRIWVAL